MLIIERPWTRQPQTVVIELNTLLFGRKVAAACLNLATPQSSFVGSVNVADPVINASQFGLVLKSDLSYGATANRPSVAIKPRKTISVSETHTVFVRYVPRAVSTDSIGVGIAGLCTSTHPTLATAGVYIGQNDDDALFFSRRFLRITVANAFTVDTPSVLANHSTGSTIRAFVDGAFSSAFSVTNDISGDWFVGGAGPQADVSSNTASPPGDVEMMLVLLGQASDAEISRVSLLMLRDPWSLVMPRRIYIPTSTAAATAPTITALSAIGITATSAQPRISYS